MPPENDTTVTATPETPAAGATPAGEEPLGAPGLAALQREREQVAELRAQLAQATTRITEFEQKDLSELERLKTDNERLSGELGTERATRLRLEIAAEHEITGEDLVLLTAGDEASMRAQAARIKAKNDAAATAESTAPLPGQGTPSTSTATDTVDAGREEYRRRHKKTT